MEEYRYPVEVDGDLASINPKTLQNKVQIYFQSKTKSQGGDCVVKWSDRSATVYFKSELTRDNVLSKENHAVTIEGHVVKLKLSKPSNKADEDPGVSATTGSDIPPVFPLPGLDVQTTCSVRVKNVPSIAITNKQFLELYFEKWGGPVETISSFPEEQTVIITFRTQDAVQRILVKTDHMMCNVPISVCPHFGLDEGQIEVGKTVGEFSTVVLEKLPDHFNRELLLLFVESVCCSSEEDFSLEFIPELRTAVVTFNEPKVAEKFLTESRTKKKFQEYGLTARALEQCKSVKVENLPDQCNHDWLELYFEKWGGDVESVTMIPDEQAAIVTFKEKKAVEKILGKQHHFHNTLVSVYPYVDPLGIVLYGKNRPTVTLPQPFTEKIHPSIRVFLHKKGKVQFVCNQMDSHFCQVNMDKDEVLLSPLPSLLRQKGITKKQIDGWMQNTTDAFISILSNFAVVEYSVTPSLWSEVEKDIRSTVKDKAVLDMDASTGRLALAGMAQDIEILRPILGDFLNATLIQMERENNKTSESINATPGVFYLLQQEGLEKDASAKYPQLELTYKKDTGQVILVGLLMEILDIKNWILERIYNMRHKTLRMDPSLVEFLRSADWEEMSGDLFISKNISAVCRFEHGDMVLTGINDKSLTEAEKELEMMLTVKNLSLEDIGVIEKPEWQNLTDQLCDTYSSSRRKAVLIKSLKDRNEIIVCGYREPVQEVTKSLENFITTHSVTVEVIQEPTEEACHSVQSTRSVQVNNIPCEPPQFIAVVLEKLPDHFNRDLLLLFVENFCCSSEEDFFLEFIPESRTAVVTFNKPKIAEKFLIESRTKKKFQEYGLTARALEESRSVKVENLPDQCNCDWLELYFEKWGGEVESITMIPDEQAAIVTFLEQDAVDKIVKQQHHIHNTSLDVYPYINSLGTALYGKDRPMKMHSVIDKDVHVRSNAVVKFIKEKKTQAWQNLLQANKVKIHFDTKRPLIRVSGERIHIQPALQFFQTMSNTLHTDKMTIEKAGAKKYFQEQGAMVMALIKDHRFVVVLEDGYGNHGSVHSGLSYDDHHQGQGNREHGDQGRRPESDDPRVYRMTYDETPSKRPTPYPRSRTQQAGMHRSKFLEAQSTQEGLKIILREGNIQDALSDVIVNIVSENLDLSQGAVPKALLQAAGPQMQTAAYANLRASKLSYGDMVYTDGYNLNCQRVCHVVCPFWNRGAGSEVELLKGIIHECLQKAENWKLASISFPAIGTGNLGFPKELVSKILLSEVHAFSARVRPQYLNEVTVIVHPSDSQTVQCFIKSFQGGGHGPITRGAHADQQWPDKKVPAASSSQSSGLLGVVSTPTLGVHKMQIGNLSLEVSSGDITKERCDAIVNSSNQNFNLKAGVSKAILDAAGSSVERECAQIAASQPKQKEIITTAGQLPSKNIIHIIGRNSPAEIKDVVYSVLKLCEEMKISSVAFPALGTGQGGVSPSAVADAMIDAVIDFVKNKKGGNVQTVKFLVFQTSMVSDFHQSMLKRQQEGAEDQSNDVVGFFKGIGKKMGLWGGSTESSAKEGFAIVREEVEPVVFQLCGETEQDLREARELINSITVKEYMSSSIQDSAINYFSAEQSAMLRDLQRELTVCIYVSKEGPEPEITLEGLTRDVVKAEGRIRDMVRKMEKEKTRQLEAFKLSSDIEWQYQDRRGNFVACDVLANYDLENALMTKQRQVTITINNEQYDADTILEMAIQNNKKIKLKRTELKDQSSKPLPSHWEDMKGNNVLRVPLQTGSSEYTDVEKEFRKTGLGSNIIKIERVQNEIPWKNYMNQKSLLDRKNQHTNNERRLFHGTSSTNIDKINNRGFDRSFAGRHGAMYGNGV